jgi:hypothetical protein
MDAHTIDHVADWQRGGSGGGSAAARSCVRVFACRQHNHKGKISPPRPARSGRRLIVVLHRAAASGRRGAAVLTKGPIESCTLARCNSHRFLEIAAGQYRGHVSQRARGSGRTSSPASRITRLLEDARHVPTRSGPRRRMDIRCFAFTKFPRPPSDFFHKNNRQQRHHNFHLTPPVAAAATATSK